MSWLKNILNGISEGRRFNQYLKRNEWMGLIPGDVVEYNGRKIMYRGINWHGGPGMPGMPEPCFGPAHPGEGECVLYIRQTGEYFPKEIFGEKNPPVPKGGATINPIAQIDEGGIHMITGVEQPAQTSSVGYIGFLNATRRDLKLVGHITPQQWEGMLEEVHAELGGGAPQ